MAFNLGQILSSAGSTGVPAYDQGYTTSLIRAGQQALGNALFMPGAQQMPGPQPPPPGQQSMPQLPAPRPYPPVQGPPQQQVVGDMFGDMGRPVEMGPPPTAMVPPVQPPPYQPPPQAPQGVGGGAPPSAGGAPPAGVGMHDPILARIAAANPGASPQVLMSAYSQYVMMNRPRYGLSPESLVLRQQRERRLTEQEQRLGIRQEDRTATRAAMQPQRAINPQTGHVIINQGGQWVDEQSGQPLTAPAKKPDKQSAADNTEFSSQARVYKGDSSQNYNPMAPKNKLDPEYQPEVRKYKGEEQSNAKFEKEQFARAQKEARPHMDYFLKGVDKEAAGNIRRAFKEADLDSLERLHELTPRQRENMHNFLADRGEFPTTDTDYEAVYGRDTTMGERPSPMTTKRWGRVRGSPSQRRPLDYLE